MKIRDVDDAHADRHHGQKLDDVDTPKTEKKSLTTPEQKAHHEGERLRQHHIERKKAKPGSEGEKKKKQQQREKRDAEANAAPEETNVKAGVLVLDDNYNNRRHTAQKLGLDGSPGMGELVDGFGSDSGGQSLGQALAERRPRHPDLEEAEFEPPIFLKPLEAMLDIYMKTRGRVTRRTKELLECIDLEDLIDLLHGLFDDPVLLKRSTARVRRELLEEMGGEGGPLLAGFHDPRLTELWRLFLEGWEIWVPEGKETGVELFWEGEAENDDGDIVEILQVLKFLDGDATLFTKLGELEDRITFDGETFYRLETVLD